MSKLELTERSGVGRGPSDDRMEKSTALQRLLRRPEAGGLLGLLAVVVVFGLATISGYANKAMFEPLGIVNWASVSAYLGVISIGACLLMIAGEFDISIGSMIGFSGMCMALLVKPGGLPAWVAISLGLLLAVAIGASLGGIVVRSRLPSFIVSLAYFFVLRGATLVIAKVVNGSTQVSGVGEAKSSDIVAWLFGGEAFGSIFAWFADSNLIKKLPSGKPSVAGIPMIVLWSVALTIGAGFVLGRTRFGNWIFATGGERKAARSSGIPVDRVRVQLFMFTALCSAIFAAAQVFQFGSADGNRGNGKEFEAILAAVVGGTNLTGGYGSVVGTLIGAMVFGAVSQGFYYTTILDGDFFRIFVGVVLLSAVLLNDRIRRRLIAEEG
jgi:simple sugar transport system permease protein